MWIYLLFAVPAVIVTLGVIGAVQGLREWHHQRQNNKIVKANTPTNEQIAELENSKANVKEKELSSTHKPTATITNKTATKTTISTKNPLNKDTQKPTSNGKKAIYNEMLESLGKEIHGK